MSANELSKVMIEFRARNNLSQEKASKAANITLQTWNSVEGGRQKPSKRTEAKIMLAINGSKE